MIMYTVIIIIKLIQGLYKCQRLNLLKAGTLLYPLNKDFTSKIFWKPYLCANGEYIDRRINSLFRLNFRHTMNMSC